MNAIVSVTADWGIGLKGRLLVRNRADMRFFRETTMGGTVVCGRTTFESFPGGALKGRRNIVLTHDRSWSSVGAEVAHDLEETLKLVADDDPERVWLIGGESIYRALLERCSRAYVTKHDVVREADAHFPDLDASAMWELERHFGTGTTDEGVPYEFVVYRHL